jgi:hypothetical protein
MEGVYFAAVLVMDCLDEALEDGFDRIELAGVRDNGRNEDGHGHSLIRGWVAELWPKATFLEQSPADLEA